MAIRNVPDIELITPDFNGAAEILREYKGRYAGRRCFVIGNGPSLRAEDLSKIRENGDFSFASNRIYLIFDKTTWRPDVFTSSDEDCIKESVAEMSSIPAKLKIIPIIPEHKMYPIAGALPVRFTPDGNNWIIKRALPPFSEDITQWISNGRTITFINIQIAAYLGFKEIILIGIDHSYAKQLYFPNDLRNYDWQRNKYNLQPGQDGQVPVEIRTFEGVQNHFCSNYADGMYDGKGEENISYWIEESVMAYQSAKKYAETHGIKILNATRGGKLNVFKRVNFDTLFRPKE